MTPKQRILLNTDWMGISLHIETPVKDAPQGYMWRTYENGTNVWKMRRILYTDCGDKVFTLLNEPKSRVIDPRAALLEVENEWLYHGIGVRGILQLLMKMCIFSVRGLSRLDLAMDFNPTKRQYHVIKQIAKGRYRVQGKGTMVPWWGMMKGEWVPEQYRGELLPYDVSWGHKTSDVRWKVYYKTKELKDAAGGMGWDKPYIVDCWRDAKFDENNVWRLEVSIHSCNGILWNGEPLTLDAWGNHTAAIAKDLYTSRFVVRANDGHKDKSNDRIVKFIPVEGWHNVRCRKGNGLAEHNGRISLLRRLVQSLDEEQILLDRVSREDVLTHIGSMVRRDGLQQYFKAMTGDYYETFCDRVRADAGEQNTGTDKYDILRVNQWNEDIKPNTKFEL